MLTLLTDAQAEFLRAEKSALSDVRIKLAEAGATPEELAILQEALLQLDELFLLVVAGEFNAGKSRLLNTLLGRQVLAEGVLPTTSQITLVRHGEDGTGRTLGGAAVVTAPVEFLKTLTIVDTPGTNTLAEGHEQLTREFVPRADLVLFVTSADRPFSESESKFLEMIRAWGKKIIVAVNKIDILESETARREVLAYVASNATRLLGVTPELFAISARDGFRAWRLDGTRDEAQWAASGLRALEQYIFESLHVNDRIRLKFENPVGVAERLITSVEARTDARYEILRVDIETAATLESQVSAYERELREELPPRLAQVELILNKFEARGIDFFHRTLRIMRVFDLARGDRIRAAFEREVLADLPDQVAQQVQATIDWVVEKDMHEWRQISGFVQRRQAEHADQLVGQAPDGPETRRRLLFDSVGEATEQVLAGYDREAEARRLAGEVEQAVAVTALAEVGAIGLGTAVMMLLSASMEPTGLVAASALAVLGLFVIPYRRRQAQERFSEQVTETRTRLMRVLTAHFNTESERALARLRDGLAPYIRFVRTEQERLDGERRALADLRAQTAEWRNRMGQL